MKAKSVLLIVVLFMLVGGFSIVPYFLQAAFYNPNTQPQSLQLPTTSIIDYELTSEQEAAILRQGKIIVKFEYNLNCQRCLELMPLIEQLANQEFKDQVFIEEIQSSSPDLPKMSVIGFAVNNNQLGLGQKVLQGGNVTQDSIVNSLCDLTLQPPVGCALRNV